MKKFIKSLMFFAVAAMTFTSCQNEIFDNDFQAEDTYTMTFVADAPQTRTSVSIEEGTAKFAWNESGEYVAFVQWSGDASNNKKSFEGVVADNKAQFGAEFKAIDGASVYNYIAVYPFDNFVSQAVADNYIRASVPAKQALTVGTFDPKADLLISKPINNVDAMGNNDVVSMEFARVASIAKMTLKGIEDGEKIKSVTFIWGAEKNDSANEGNRFVGKYEFNFEGNVTKAAFEGQNYVELTTATGISAIKAGTDIYFTCLPGAYSGSYTIEVITDKATYKKSAELADEKALNFTSGNVLSFGLAFGESHREEIKVTGYYRKVTSTLADFSGEYLIVYEGGNVAFDGSLTTLDATSNTINVTIDDNAIEATDVVKKSVFTIAKVSDGYTIKSASGYYIGRTATSNGLTSNTSTTYTNSITISNDGNATITSSGGPTLKFNNASDQKRFRYFKSGQQAVQLYKLEGEIPEPLPALETPTVTATASGNEIAVSWNAISGAGTYTVTCGTDEQEVSTTDYTFTALAYNKTYEISVVANPANDEVNSASAPGTATATTEADPEQPGQGGAEPVEKEYVWSLLTSQLNGKTSVTQGGVTWAYSVNSGVGYTSTGTDGATSVQIGSNSKPLTSMSFTTSGIGGKIKSIVVNGANSGSKTNTKMTITVGGVSYCSNEAFTSTNLADYTYNGTSSGEIVIKFTGSAAGVKLHQIKVVYEE
ncbi:MAG: hypothetical protein IIX00_07070 [Tidjanibacter sp.]|nr:hypothetical protein [Tidjanibacter sp.]